MSVVEVERMIGDGKWSVVNDGQGEGKTSPAVTYAVTVDDVNDGPVDFMGYAGNRTVVGGIGLPVIGEPYGAGNEETSATLFCIRRTATQVNAFLWHVRIEYTTEGFSGSGAHSDNPLMQPGVVRLFGQIRKRAIAYDIRGTPIIDPFGQLFNPPIEVEDTMPVLTITRNEWLQLTEASSPFIHPGVAQLANWITTDDPNFSWMHPPFNPIRVADMPGTINYREFSPWSDHAPSIGPGHVQTNISFPRHTLKCHSVTAEPNEFIFAGRRVAYKRMTYEFHVGKEYLLPGAVGGRITLQRNKRLSEWHLFVLDTSTTEKVKIDGDLVTRRLQVGNAMESAPVLLRVIYVNGKQSKTAPIVRIDVDDMIAGDAFPTGKIYQIHETFDYTRTDVALQRNNE